jgi:hypothetical protein
MRARGPPLTRKTWMSLNSTGAEMLDPTPAELETEIPRKFRRV